MREPIAPPRPLVCAECLHANRNTDGRGGKADLAGGHDDQGLELVILCPACREREFADDD